MLVSPFGVALTLALLLLVVWTDRELRSHGGSLLDRPMLVLGMLGGAALGGRGHYLLESWLAGVPPRTLVRLASPFVSGTTFFGAASGAVAVLVLMRRWLPRGGLPVFADALVWGTAGAIFVGRIGCLVQGCCLGIPIHAPWGLHSPIPAWSGREDLVSRQPFALYIGVWAVLSAALAWRWTRRKPSGQRFLAFVALFAAGRFPLEFLRDHPEGGVFPSLQQWESVILLVVALSALLLDRLRPAAGRIAGARGQL